MGANLQTSKRPEESEIDQNYMDMALAIQQVTNEIVLRLCKTAQKLTGSKNIVMAEALHLIVSLMD